MKTFPWTIPDPPLSKPEKNPAKTSPPPGTGRFALAIMICLISWIYLGGSSSFFKGLQTYFWEESPATVTGNDLRFMTTSGSGSVAYTYQVDGAQVLGEDQLFQKWSGNTEEKFLEWASQYEPGKTITIYHNSAGESSLGHWPKSYVLSHFFAGMVWLSLAAVNVVIGIRKWRAWRQEAQPGTN